MDANGKDLAANVNDNSNDNDDAAAAAGPEIPANPASGLRRLLLSGDNGLNLPTSYPDDAKFAPIIPDDANPQELESILEKKLLATRVVKKLLNFLTDKTFVSWIDYYLVNCSGRHPMAKYFFKLGEYLQDFVVKNELFTPVPAAFKLPEKKVSCERLLPCILSYVACLLRLILPHLKSKKISHPTILAEFCRKIIRANCNYDVFLNRTLFAKSSPPESSTQKTNSNVRKRSSNLTLNQKSKKYRVNKEATIQYSDAAMQTEKAKLSEVATNVDFSPHRPAVISPPKVRSQDNSSQTPLVTHQNRIINSLLNGSFADDLEDKLAEAKQCSSFVNVMEAIACGRLDTRNIAWKSALDRGKWSMLENTCGMKYDKDLTEFYRLIYLIFGQSALNVLRGSVHFGKVVDHETRPGYYEPELAECNFAVPSINTLKKVDIGYPAEIKPGFINHTFDVIENVCAGTEQQYFLSFDGKMCSQGSKGFSDGDVNLWGAEKPSLTSKVQILESSIELAHNICKDISLQNSQSKILQLRSLCTTLSKAGQKLSNRISKTFQKRKDLIELSEKYPNNASRYAKRMSFLNDNATNCENVLRKATELNLSICKTVAMIQGTASLISESRYVDISEQANAFQLLNATDLPLNIDLDDDENSVFIKQRSELWHAKRKEARVTGSTLYTATGLSSLKEQKQHHYTFVKGRNPVEFTADVRKRLNYGTANEVNAVATVLGAALPAFKPPCHAFIEVGTKFVNSKKRNKILAVSGDGVVRCVWGDTCPYQHLANHSAVAIEAKCPFPDSNRAEAPHYQIPVRYVTQVLSEMAAYDAKELWFVSFTRRSTAISRVHFSANLWNDILNIVDDLYGADKVNVPTKLHSDVHRVRKELKEFTETHASVMLELPPFYGTYGELVNLEDESPFAGAPTFDLQPLDFAKINRNCQVLSSSVEEVFRSMHNVLRDQATEVVVFMLTNKDRMQMDQVPYSLPAAYGLKGNSMTNENLRFMVNKVRNELKRRKIPILCEFFDGQWQNTVNSSEDGAPLTKLQVGKLVWSRVQKMSKDTILKKLNASSHVAPDLSNIHITENSATSITCTLTPCKYYCVAGMPYIASKKFLMQRPRLVPKVLGKRRKKQYGLTEDEDSLVNLLDPKTIQDIQQEEEDEDVDDDDLPDLVIESKMLTNTVLGSHAHILANILDDLQETSNKWLKYSIESLYRNVLRNHSELITVCKNSDLQIISRVLQHNTGRCFFKSGLAKPVNAMYIAEAFGGVVEDLPCRPRKQNYEVKPLYYFAKKVLHDEEYDLRWLQASIAHLEFEHEIRIWEKNATVALTSPLADPHPEFQGEDRELPVMEHFSYPEFSKERNQLEPRTLDYSHILTNMRNHILTTGYSFCPREHFIELAKDQPKLISLAAVLNKIDIQNVFIAKRMFSAPVEAWFRAKGYSESADFVCLVRNWFAACDERGLEADDRVQKLHAMQFFLLKDLNLNAFPPNYCGRHIKSMPAQTYEALLQNISTRVQLYSLSCDGTYSARAGTAPNESFFSDLLRMEKETPGYIKACNIPRLMGKVVTMNYYKHKKDKAFCLQPTLKPTYPVQLAEDDFDRYQSESKRMHDGLYRDHFFDFADRHKSSRVRKDDISTGLAPVRNNPGVRRFYRTNEADILPEIRSGKEPKGFRL